MTPTDFLAERKQRPLSLDGSRFSPVAAFDGNGKHALEVALATTASKPRADDLRRAWKARHGGAPNPLLLIAAYQEDGAWKTSICGPAGDDPPVEADLDLGLVERVAAAALDQPSRHQAIRFLSGIFAEVEAELPGIRNHGMLATHELREGVPLRADWPAECERARPLLSSNGRELVEGLGFTIDQHSTATTVLSIGDARRAIAVFLDETEEFEAPATRFDGASPVTHALAYADRAELAWVVVTRGTQIRLYSARPDIGVGRKGRADTYVEANLALVPDDRAGYVTLLFSADALKTDGTLTEILETSHDYAAGLGQRLRDRVYEEAVPSLALALASRHSGDLDEAALNTIYEQALTVLFRLLFVAYAEDKDLLPYRSNGAYRDHALKTRARELAERSAAEFLVFDPNATDLWGEVTGLWIAVDKGNVERGVPPYNGGLFSADGEVNAAGAALSTLSLSNAEFGPSLVALLVDESEDGVVGPVDFRSLSVREFGTIYEGLLQSSLSVALSDLTLDEDRNYVPASAGDRVLVAEGDVYFHNRSGARKSSGTYFTKPFAVEHLLDHALEPALDDHLARLQGLVDVGEEGKAADAFFDFRCVDLAMGSGHFLVAAVDRIEAKLSGFLALTPIPQVTAELERLRAAAYEALGPLGEGIEIEHASLLRRHVARRCIYGVDLNPVAVELARLGIWIHTFVPGLPLSFLDRTLVTGDSLTGIGTLEEAVRALDPGEHESGTESYLSNQIRESLARAESALRRLAGISDATAAEIADARTAHSEAQASVQHARDLFNLVVAARFGEAQMPTAFDEESVKANPDLLDARRLADEVAALHYPVVFPEVFLRDRAGFDCILGNPPWDKVLFEAQAFWVARVPGLNRVPQNRRESEIDRLRGARAEDAALERREQAQRERFQRYAESTFVLRGRGHYDYAKFFVERALALSGERGTLGYVLPRQALVLGGWGRLRAALLDQSSVTVLQARNRGGWFFDDVEHRYMVVLLGRTPSREPQGSAGHVLVWPCVTSVDAVRAASADTATSLGRAELDELSDSFVIPWLNDPLAGPVFDAFRSRPSVRSAEAWVRGRHDARWDFRGSGPDRDLVVTESSWAALMTRHVDAFRIDSGEPLRTYLDAAGLVKRARGIALVDGQPALETSHPAIVVRHPSRNDDARTLISTLLPARGLLHNKGYVHAFAHEPDTSPQDVLALLGWLNSLTCDWWVRRFVDRHVTAPVVNNIRVPDWEVDVRSRVAALASTIIMARDPKFESCVPLPDSLVITEEEALTEIETLSLRGIGLAAEHLDVILDDFSEKGCPSSLRRQIRASFEA